MKKKILLCLIAQLICWSIMTLSDYIEETYNDSYNLVVVFAVPLICVILYIIFRKWIYDNQIVRLKDVAIICAAWMICGLILGFLIGALVMNEMWIVPQATGGWEHLLNGIEYMMFAITLAGIPFVAVVLIESVVGIEKIKQVMDACYQAKRVRDMMPKLPNEVTPTHIHYLDVITKLELDGAEVKVSDISDELGLPRPGVTKTIKDMERLGFVEKKASEADGRIVYIRSTQAGRDLVGKYVDEYFTGLGESLVDITDEDADIMIATIEKIYDVMSKRSQDIR